MIYSKHTAMKNPTKLLIAVMVSLLSFESYSQTIRIIGGFNLSNILIKDNEETYSKDFNMNPGFHIGGTVDFPLSSVLSINTGLFLDSKGFKLKEEEIDVVIKEKLNLYYLDIPIVLKASNEFDNGMKIFGIAGPYIGIGLFGKVKSKYEFQGNKETSEDEIEWGNDPYEDDFRRFDTGITFGSGIEVKSFLFGISFDLGLFNLVPGSDWNIQVKNRVLRFSVGYRFGKFN